MKKPRRAREVQRGCNQAAERQTLLQRIQEVDQICLLGGAQPETEVEIVKVDQVLQVRGRAGVKERRSHREVAQDRRLEQPASAM
jgi:hypothetical protein